MKRYEKYSIFAIKNYKTFAFYCKIRVQFSASKQNRVCVWSNTTYLELLGSHNKET